MELADARTIAQGMLAEIDSPDEPLTLVPAEQVVDIGWAWVFAYTTVRWSTGAADAAPPPGGGPIVVVKDLGRAWMMLGSRDYDEQLAEFAARYGYS
ncbi:hypothetical protein [Alloactinosynnema sp. L-07]|uniref:YrhB domain-containing protein n=1 Tax=Alloactinosynnema sp. L-07 TaxID=1653480 RepID=UPI00065EFACB|nr:YrhB domain-containing protein [Alloactinosynnema sp. L-07]CRK58759.1 hypothetical protein [Alloactinosynnema sp. L-07]